MELTFFLGPNDGRAKRKSPRGACAPCRGRKKRCIHEEKPEKPEPEIIKPSVRFIGYLNPLAVFLERSTKEQQVGVWLDHDDNCFIDGIPPTISSTIFESNESILPPLSDQTILLDRYFSRIHPILPLLDEADTRTRFTAGTLPPALLQAIFLVISKDPGHHALRLGTSPSQLDVSTFTRTLYKYIVHFLSRAERRSITTIQVLALISLHASGPDGMEEASLHLMQAIHHAQTLGLHLTTQTGPPHSTSHLRLFWCLWSLDRWNAAVNGRPVLIGNRDMQSTMDEAVECSEAPFRIWLRLSAVLDQIICLYRPTSERQEPVFPTFEQMVDEAGGYLVSESILISLELLYHGISILASDGPKGLTIPIPSAPRIRQSLSTIQIVSIIQSSHARTLLALPMIAYSISLCLSASYKHLRCSRLPTTRHTARTSLSACCTALSDYATLWWSAGVISRLGRRALDDLDSGRLLPDSHSGLSERQTQSSPHTQSESQSESTYERGMELANAEGIAPILGDFHSATATVDVDNFLGSFLDLNIPRNLGESILGLDV